VPGSVRDLTPGASPTAAAKPPQIKRLDPLPDAQVFAGNVRFMLQVSSTANLAKIAALLDGREVRPVVGERSPRLWSVSFIGNLAPGTHEVNVEAHDADGQLGALVWQFEVVPGVGQVATPAAALPGPPQGTPIPQSTPEEPAPQGDATVAAPPLDATAAPVEPTAAPPVVDQPTPSDQPTAAPAEPTPEAAPSPDGQAPTPEGEQPTAAPAEPTAVGGDGSNEQDNQG
jgi:hypothetical protein